MYFIYVYCADSFHFFHLERFLIYVYITLIYLNKAFSALSRGTDYSSGGQITSNNPVRLFFSYNIIILLFILTYYSIFNIKMIKKKKTKNVYLGKGR